MSIKFITGMVVALALASTPALACKGRNVAVADDFSREDAAWEAVWGELTVSNGRGQLKSEPGKLAMVIYNGEDFESGDICVDMISPNVRGGVFAGIAFGATFTEPFGMYAYVLNAAEGTIGVIRHSKGKWLWPVNWRKSDAVKQQAGAANNLRLTWKGSAVVGYVNDRQAVQFTVQPIKEAKFGLFALPEAETFQFDNLKVSD